MNFSFFTGYNYYRSE
nr:unnamed protein product [Callosobruchus chinensis]